MCSINQNSINYNNSYLISMPLFLKLLSLLVILLPINAISKYNVVNKFQNASTIILDLSYFGQDQYYLKPTSPVIRQLQFILTSLSFDNFQFKIIDIKKKRYQVPSYPPFPADKQQNFTFPIDKNSFEFTYNATPFDFQIISKNKASTIYFSTYQKQFIYSQYFLQIGTQINSDQIYGFGERFSSNFRKTNGKWTIFNRYRGGIIDEGKGLQTYGHYPFYYIGADTFVGDPHINLLRNSNGMDIIKDQNGTRHFLTYKVIGGIFHFRFFISSLYSRLIRDFHSNLGPAPVPPFWALGFHQSRWGYNSSQQLKEVIDNFERNHIPLQTIWSDIDYMSDFQNFSVDQKRFPENQMKSITDKYRYIVIVDAGILENSTAYKIGKERNVFIQDANGGDFRGIVYRGDNYFVDFFHPNASNYWSHMLTQLHNKLNFSGVWLDMNEVHNFCNGQCYDPEKPSKFDFTRDLPYHPGSDSIQTFAIALNATHYGGQIEQNVHAFYGLMQTEATNRYLKSIGLRPFIISRSTSIGSSLYGYHWTGDNKASWEFLRSSIIDNFNAGIAGIQMVGPDICGFEGNTTVQLCARWFQLGSMYPFARNHNDIFSISQQPYALGDVVLQSAINNLKLRYSLLKHIYYEMVKSNGLGTIFSPICLTNFDKIDIPDSKVYDQMCNTQFFVGYYILATPILQEGATGRKIFLPYNGNWCDLHSGKIYPSGFSTIENIGLTDLLPLFIFQESGVMMQDATNVTKVAELTSTFTFVGCFSLFQKNKTHNIYLARAYFMAFADFNDEYKVSRCEKTTCQQGVYIKIYVEVPTGIRRAQIIADFYTYEMDPKYIDRLKLYYQNKVIDIKLANKLRIYGNQNYLIDLPNQSEPSNLKFQSKQ